MSHEPGRVVAELAAELDVAEAKAWDALGRYKFQMFGYWAAIWVHLNRIGGFKRPSPWRDLVKQAAIHSKRPPAPLASPNLLEALPS